MPHDDLAPAPDATLDLACEMESVTRARVQLLESLERRGVADRLAADAAAVLSELVINALLHGVPDDDGRVRVGWRTEALARAEGHRVVLTVHDAGGYGRPHVESPDEHASAGRGLRIVDSMCASWSVDTSDGTCVTAELRTPRSD